eukprot:TRINITY_DN10312_c0_g1_i1.p1 TRINITY_DN10312_c0_g1~~TRINITY_DN10312_c0_g1_i1.p1  ORF type:complete len:1137 (-),score=289.10 TRINITY_DN10312_c0_g1_i1:227-3637(-)
MMGYGGVPYAYPPPGPGYSVPPAAGYPPPVAGYQLAAGAGYPPSGGYATPGHPAGYVMPGPATVPATHCVAQGQAPPGYDAKYPPQAGAVPAGGGAAGGMPGAPSVPSACAGNSRAPEALVVSGCQHATVGGIVRGNFTYSSENHAKPVYRKDQQVNGLDVMLYYWDERDGPNFCGWWFGPRVGGDQVWAYHPDKTAMSPPLTGWKVPYDGPVDTTFKIEVRSSNAAGWGPAGQPTQAQAPAPHAAYYMPPGHPGFPVYGQPQPQGAVYDPQTVMRRQEEDRRRAEQHRQDMERRRVEDQRRDQDAKRKREEEDSKRRVDQKRQAEQQKKREVEFQKQREDDQRRKDEEGKRRKEVEEKRRAEQKSTLAIRRVIQEVKAASPENFPDLQKKLKDILAEELESTGTQRQRICEEQEKCIEQTKKRIEQLNDHRKREQEKRTAEMRKANEAEEKALALAKELSDLVETAETKAGQLKQTAAPLEDDSELMVGDVEKIAHNVEVIGLEAKELTKACTDFILEKGSTMKDLAGGVLPFDEAALASTDAKQSETKVMLGKLLQRINECTRTAEADVQGARGAKDKAVRRAAAREKTKAMEVVFEKYDKDADDVLSRKEVVAYARGEYKLVLPEDTLEQIWRNVVDEGSKGVRLEKFQWLRTIVGVARERTRDLKRKAQREQKEKVLMDMKAALQQRIKEVGMTVDTADKDVGKVEEMVKPFIVSKAKVMPAPEMIGLADETDEMIRVAKASVDEARAQIDGLSDSIEEPFKEDLLAYLALEGKQLELRMGRMGSRVNRASNLSVRFREQANKKKLAELEKLRWHAVRIVHYNQKLLKLTGEALFSAIDVNRDDEISEGEFINFFSSADREIKEIDVELPPDCPMPEAKAEVPKDGEKVENGAGNGAEGAPAKSEEGAGDAAKETADKPVGPTTAKLALGEDVKAAEEVELTDEALSRLFAHLLDEGESGLTREAFFRMMRVFMKVVNSAAMTAGISLKASSCLRRLEVNEVVEILEGPLREDSVDVRRVMAKAMKDGIEGWITLAGNQGTVFLKEGGNTFKVVKDTILTEEFELDGNKETQRKVKDGTRKLKEDEYLEVYEWPKREDKSGLMRMKAKAKSDGSIGWVTMIGNSGTVFLEVV